MRGNSIDFTQKLAQFEGAGLACLFIIFFLFLRARDLREAHIFVAENDENLGVALSKKAKRVFRCKQSAL